jgi:hypothetical protein
MIITDSVFIRGKPYLITFNGSLVDCSGNASDTALDVRVAIPDSLVPGCALVSEVLPDPAPGGERYVEIYNNSIKVVDISEMLLVVDWDQAGGPLSGEPLALSPYLLFPGDYLVVTPSPTDIVARYHAPHPGVILKLDYFPSMNSDSGWIGITSKATNSILDKMVYSKSMHYPLLRTNEGVSLERIDIDRPSTDRSNWFSAAESFWFGTPGYRNSHAGAKPAGGGTVEVHPPVFSPDNDGFQDILTIVARAEPPGSMINLWIFDSRGRIIRDVARNVLGGKEEVFYWDGINSSGEKAAVGLYIILAEFFHPDGTSDRLKTAVALAGRF